MQQSQCTFLSTSQAQARPKKKSSWKNGMDHFTKRRITAWFTRQVLCSTITRRKALHQKGQRNHNGSKQNAKERHQFGVQAVAIAK